MPLRRILNTMWRPIVVCVLISYALPWIDTGFSHAQDATGAAENELIAKLDRAGLDVGSQRTLPKEVVAVLGSNFGRHSQTAKCVALSPDERYVASGSRNEAVRIWDAKSMELIRSFPHPEDVDHVWFSSDSKFIHTACWDGVVRTFDLQSDKLEPISRLVADLGKFKMATFQNGDRLLASSSKERARRSLKPAIIDYEWNGREWKPKDRKFIGFATFQSEDIEAIACSDDGRLIATPFLDRGRTALSKSMVIWEQQGDDYERKGIAFAGGPVERMTFDPQGEFLVLIVQDGSVYSLSLKDESLQKISESTKDKAYSISFSRSLDQLFVGNLNGSISIWDWKQGRPKLQETIVGHGSWVSGITWSKDNRVMYSSGWDHTVRRWTRDKDQWSRSEIIGHDHPVGAIAFSKNGRWIATGAESEISMNAPENEVLVWELGGAQPALKHRLTGCFGSISSLAFSEDSTLLAASHDKGIRSWNVGTFDATNDFTRTDSDDKAKRLLSSEALCFVGKTHRILSGWDEGMVLFVDLGIHPAKELDAWKAPFHYVESIDITADGTTAFTSSIPVKIDGDKLIVADNKELKDLEAKAAAPRPERVGNFEVYRPIKTLYSRVASNSDATLFVGATREGAITIYKNYLQPTESTFSINAHSTVIEAIDVREDGLIASGDWDGNVRLWDSSESKSSKQEWNLGRVWSLRFSPNGEYLAVGSGSGLVYLLRIQIQSK